MMIEKKYDIPLVSVIIPVYNAAGTIKKTLDSVFLQDIDMEILLIDDCSTDESDKILEEYQKDFRVHYYRNKKNLGASGSRNFGVSIARGEYIAFLDADDWWEKGKLKKQLQLMKETEAVLCCTARELVTWEGKQTGRVIPVKKEITYKELLKHNSINCSSVLIRSDVMKQFKMEHEDSHEDYILWLKILKQYGSACAVNEPLLKYRLSNKGKSGNKLRSAYMTYKVYRYAGFGTGKSLLCFCSYALHGIIKYALAFSKTGQ